MKTSDILRLDTISFPLAADVIRHSFATVAAEFGITKENCPTHTSFITAEQLNVKHAMGYDMFGLFDGEAMIGYASVSKRLPENMSFITLPFCPNTAAAVTVGSCLIL